MRKTYITLLSLVFAGCLVSCDDFLDQRNPNKQSSDTFWQTEEELLEGLNAAYRPFRFTGEYGRWIQVLYIARSDEGYSQSPNATFVSYSNFRTENHSGSEGLRFPWLDLYKGIFWANQVIYNAEHVTKMDDEALRARIIGEATFIRGVHYFNLAGLFGRGPITLSPLAVEDNPIAEQDGLYEQARKDLELAAEEGRLPVVYANAAQDLGRITRGAALGMLAKVYAQQRNWEEMEKTCKLVIDLKTSAGADAYGLVSNYADNFSRATEFNKESVFELVFKDGIENGIGLGHQWTKFLGFPCDLGAWDDSSTRPWVKTEMQKEKTSSGAVDPRLTATLYYYDGTTSGNLIYGKTWSQWGPSTSRVFWKKYTDPASATGETLNNGNNIRLVRLADIYLMYAEALNENGKTADAYQWINKVRNRAGLVNLESSTVFTGIGNDKAKMREQLMHERLCELACEGWRWLDLERWGCFETQAEIDKLKARDLDFENFVIGKCERLPIPVREIGLVPGLVQNPNW